MREDWIDIEIGEIANIYNGNSINAQIKEKKYKNLKDGFNYIGTKDVGFDAVVDYENGVKIPYDENSFKIAPKGCVLVCSEGGSAGRKTAFIEQDVCFGNKLYAITDEFKVLEGKYVFYYSRYRKFFEDFKNQMNGIIGGVSTNKFAEILFPLAPVPIQRAIISKTEELFSDLDNGIANFKKAQEQLKIYRQAVLKKAFEGELTKDWREKQRNLPTAEELLKQIKEERQNHYNQQIEDWKKTVKEWEKNGKVGKKLSKPSPLKNYNISNSELERLGELTNGFTWVPFGNVFSDSPQNGLYKHSSKYGSGIDIVRIDNFYEGVLNNTDGFKKVELEDEEIEKYKLENAQILVNRVNSIDYLGKTGLVKNLHNPTVFESNIMKVSVVKKNVIPEYIVHYLTSGIGIKEIRKNAKHAVNQASINQTDVSLAFIPLCSKEEQNQIVQEIESRLSVCDKVEQSLEESIEKAKVLRQSILKKAFEGNLLSKAEIEQCKKETDYEPASELLKKIKAEKLEKEKALRQAQNKNKITKKKSKK